MAHWVVGLLQLLLLAVFVCGVLYLNTYRPERTHYRPFRIRWWVPTVAGVMMLLLLASLLHLPHHLQHTNQLVARRHADGRAECREMVERGAQHAERAVLFASEYFHDRGAAKPVRPSGALTVFELLSPLLNQLLFNSGVTICAVPLLVHLLSLHLRRPATSSREQWLDIVRRESGVVLPVLNFISLVSALSAPTFYLFIQPGRVDRCVYTSGHWFTFSLTLLTFSVILAHLASYQHYCRSSGQLLTLFLAWLGVYGLCALSVLKKTQEAYHDSMEAVDGIRQSLPTFALYMLAFIALQYITHRTTDPNTDDPPQPSLQKDTIATVTALSTNTATGSEEPTRRSVQPSTTPAIEFKYVDSEQAAAPSNIPDAPPPPSSKLPLISTSTAVASRLTHRKAGTSILPPPVSSPRSTLLAAIKGRVPLRPTPTRQWQPRTALTGLEAILSETRKVLEPDSERETEQEDGWD